jgi:CheY-like chemotaxis protein
MGRNALERRGSQRAPGVVGSATVFVAETSTTCSVVDLSAGGVMLIAPGRFSPGEHMDVVFEADSDRLTGICLRVEVVRCQPVVGGHYAIGTVFLDLPRGLRDHIQELVATALERKRASAPATVLVADEAPQACWAVASDVAQSGRRVVAASTPVEVLRHLHDVDLRIEAALVDVRFGDSEGLAILAYLAEQHPTVRRVLVSDRTLARNYERLLATGRAHAFLTKPWELQCLVAALAAS